ncbi:MAG: hypothetical protein AAGG46_12130, partial [Planctomycetota bacterium]
MSSLLAQTATTATDAANAIASDAAADVAADVAADLAIDAQWRLEAAGALAPGLTILLLAAAAGLVAYCYTREASPAGRAYRVLLGLLRMTTVVLLL